MTGRDVDRLLRAARKALRRLDAAQGLVARRNARRALAAALRVLRADVDATYPSLRGKARRRARGTEKERRVRLARAGWQPVSSAILVQALREAGCATRRIGSYCYAKAWALRLAMAGVPRSEIRRALRNVGYRQALLAEVACRQQALLQGGHHDQ